MTEKLQCVSAIALPGESERKIQRCRGLIVRPSEEEGYECSDEGDGIHYSQEVVASFAESPLWHTTFAISKLLAKLTPFNPTASNSSYPWIDLPSGLADKAIVETTTGTWDVHFEKDGLRTETRSTDIPTASRDAEAIAHKIAAIVNPS